MEKLILGRYPRERLLEPTIVGDEGCCRAIDSHDARGVAIEAACEKARHICLFTFSAQARGYERAHTSTIPGGQKRGYIPCHLPPHFRLGAMSNRVPACILRAIDHPERGCREPTGGSFTVRESFRVLRTPILPNPFKEHLFTSKFSEQSCQLRRTKRGKQ